MRNHLNDLPIQNYSADFFKIQNIDKFPKYGNS